MTVDHPRVTVVSVNVGRASELTWRGRTVRTGIGKEPQSVAVRVEALGLEGDVQVDRRVHGGTMKAVYAYPGEHYERWAAELGVSPDALPPGAFGENLTLEGILEDDIRPGDELVCEGRDGLRLAVTEPRYPCSTLSARFQRADLPRLFVRAARPGFYLRVVTPGRIGAGDTLELVRSAAGGESIRDIFRRVARVPDDTE